MQRDIKRKYQGAVISCYQYSEILEILSGGMFALQVIATLSFRHVASLLWMCYSLFTRT